MWAKSAAMRAPKPVPPIAGRLAPRRVGSPASLLLCVAAWTLSACAPSATAAPAGFGRGPGGKADGVGDPDLPREITTLVENHCARCHAGPGARKGVRMDSYAFITGPAPK